MKKYLISIISILLFLSVLGFACLWRVFTKQEIPSQLLSALLGASVTVVITNLLLNSQTESEFNKQKQGKVYEEKLYYFRNYLQLVCQLSLGRSLNEKQRMDLQCQVSLIAMHMEPCNLKEVVDNTDHILTSCCQVDERGKENVRKRLMNIVQCFRRELYGKSISDAVEIGNIGFDTLASNATLYNEYPQVGSLPSDYTVKQQSEGFSWFSTAEKWEEMGWKKDDGNAGSDYLRYYLGDKENPLAYVEVRYEIFYKHYILRVLCRKTPDAVESLFIQFGGFKNKELWWKVLDSPFFEMPRCELLNHFDHSDEYKEALFPWFDAAIYTIDRQGK